MLVISQVTVYPLLLHAETLPFTAKNGNALNISFFVGHTAMFWGKVPYQTIGKKYAIVKDTVTQKPLTIDEWTPEIKNYFEKEKIKYKAPFRYRFGWLYVWLSVLLFIIALFAVFILYMMLSSKK